MPLPPRPSPRLDEPVRLPLDRYGLEPGDVIKLFGRVEDNDPAGAKGAESSVVTVRIISQEEFERMLQAREGIEAMLSKYYAAQRRMESLAKKMDGLRKKMKGQRGDAKRSEETRRQLGRLAEAMRREAAEIRHSAESLMPYDIDKALTPELQQLAKTSEAMAKQLEELQREKDLLNKKLAGRLDEMAKRLASARRLYDEQAVEPMEYIAGVLPLLADQQRFVMLALWQQDLAERLASLKGRDGQDDPSMKARIRDLEEEQQQIRDALANFLDNMQEHIDKLPDKEEVKELRESAEKFVKGLRKSGAAEAMGVAESALAEFKPTRGHKKAKEAADILEKFIKECKNCGNCAGKGLKFQPSVSNAIGNSLAQLLAAMGLGDGMGGGSGMNGFGPTGLYGGLPAGVGESRSGLRPRRRLCPARNAARRSATPARHDGTSCSPRRRRRRQRRRRTAALSAAGRPILPARRRRDWRERAIIRRTVDMNRVHHSSLIIHHLPRAAVVALLAASIAALAWAAPDARQSGGEPDGIVQVANLVYAGTKSSRCFSDHFLIKAEKEIGHLHQPALPRREARRATASTSFRW